MVSAKAAGKPESSDPAEPHTPGEPGRLITNRFLFVDVAALRAKQLKRGARPRVLSATADPDESVNTPAAAGAAPDAEASALSSMTASTTDDVSESPPRVRPVLRPLVARKLERIAMDEVELGLIGYDLPAPKPPKAHI